MTSNQVKTCLGAALALWLAVPCPADEIADKGRTILEKNAHAIVTVEVVLKITYSSDGRTSPPNETRQEITGTVIDPSGLAVLALSAADPSDMYRRMMASRYPHYTIDTEVSDIKILLDDGTEVPAEIVLRDKDKDLAFIRPKVKPATPMEAVDLTKSSKAQLLDQYISINRLNKASGRAYSASVERICAVVERPRRFYIPDSNMTATALGSPAFTLDGGILGVDVMHTVGAGDDGMNSRSEDMTSIVLPAEDILKSAIQAPEAKDDTNAPTISPEVKDSKGTTGTTNSNN